MMYGLARRMRMTAQVIAKPTTPVMKNARASFLGTRLARTHQ